MNIVQGLTRIFPAMRISGTRHYAMRNDLPIKWIRPEKPSCISRETSGDCSPLPMADPKQFMLEFQKSKELEMADERVKNIFRIGNNPRKERIRMYVDETIWKVQRHDLDYGSMEARIAKMTGKIRSMQDLMEKFPRNKKLKVILKEMIDKRKKFLLYMRRWDYRRYEWLLEKLDLVFKQFPEQCIRVERKASLRKLIQIHCDSLRQEKLDAYRKKLEGQQLEFLERKYKNLQFIRNEQIACQVQVTVSEEDVKNAKARYEEMREKQKKVNEDEDLEAEA